MSKIALIVVLLSFAACLASSFEIFEKENGELFYLVPLNEEHNRVRRQTKANVDNNGVSLSHTGKLFENQNHRLDGTAFGQKDFKNHGPLTAGGNLDYNHKPTGSNLNLGASNTRGFGTDVSAKGQYNFLNSKRTQAGVGAYYNRHFGGPGGSRRPDYGAFVSARYNF
ncbi:PREDICTED: uncharacterized protein LOC108567297 [Nicrophorus vespilloides]|uniref:Uncharacterized protein LOC108567297 n=1 Tax=Nicrophorus vespilloides TaxID=110193 RepID=A0ABM1N8K8_NICVS|nr:PREDICTED: uncharacterized protein LOC108567297 [Nicrophorus vespilloides]